MMIQVDERFKINDGLKSVVYNFLTHTSVLTRNSLINYLFDEFETRDDKYWLNGKGKIAYLDMLTKFLSKEDQFFNRNKKLIDMGYRRYADFCNQNVIHACLGSVVNETPLVIIDPEYFEQHKKRCLGSPGAWSPDHFPGQEGLSEMDRLPV